MLMCSGWRVRGEVESKTRIRAVAVWLCVEVHEVRRCSTTVASHVAR